MLLSFPAVIDHAAVLAMEPYAMIVGVVFGAIIGGIVGAFIFGSSVCSSARVHGSVQDLKRPGHVAAGVGVTLLFAAMGYGLGGIIAPMVVVPLASWLFWVLVAVVASSAMVYGASRFLNGRLTAQ